MAGQYPVALTPGVGGFGSTNQSTWYNGGGCQLNFPSLNVGLYIFVYDENASGMVGDIDPSYQATYELLSTTEVKIRFACLARGLGLTGNWYWGIWWKQQGHETYTSTPYNADRAGSTVWRQVPIEITCLLDIFTLGVPLGAFSESTYGTIIG